MIFCIRYLDWLPQLISRTNLQITILKNTRNATSNSKSNFLQTEYTGFFVVGSKIIPEGRVMGVPETTIEEARP
jgi:hypothetical protein